MFPLHFTRNEVYLTLAKAPKFHTIWTRVEQTKKAAARERENSARESKRNIQYIHFLHKAYSEFIILPGMDIQNHTILQ